MDITKTLVSRVSEYYKTNKKPCKSYATIERAEKEAASIAEKAASYFQVDDVDYIVFFVPVMGRYCIGFNMQKVISSKTGGGGFIGFCGNHFLF